MAEPTDDSQEHPIDALAEDFVLRYRLGEHPALTEYISRHPELEDEIRDLFPTLIMMEKARSQDAGGESEKVSAQRFGNHSAPRQLGEFQILREVGRGGMGIVYEALQDSLGRHVALKILPTHSMQNPKHLQRFQREVRAAARLNHPNIVPVYGAGEVDGTHYYAMQFIQGLALDQVASEVKRLRMERTSRNTWTTGAPSFAASIAEGLMSGVFGPAEAVPSTVSALPNDHADIAGDSTPTAPDPRLISSGASSEQLNSSSMAESGGEYWNSIARIGIQVADALQYASDHGVLHRDIKPANLLLDLKGNIWVTDFGLAKSDDSDELTNPGDIIGTLRYLPPERLEGDSDLRSDIYSTGATLYELLVLRPLFDGVKRERLLSVIAEVDPPRPRLIDGTIPRDLETIVLKAMSKDAIDRYATATELAEDLRRFLDDRPVLARRVRIIEKLWRWCRRNRILAGLAVTASTLAVIVVVMTSVASLVKRERDNAVESRNRAQTAELEKGIALRRAETAERESRIRAHLARATAIRQGDQEGHRFDSLKEIQIAATLNPTGELQNDLRETAISAMGLTDIIPSVTCRGMLNKRTATDHAMAHIAAVDIFGDQSLSIRRIADGREIFHHAEPNPRFQHVDLQFSQDDRYLLINYFMSDGNQRLDVREMKTSDLALSVPIHSLGHYGQATTIHPDGKTLVLVEDPGTLVVYDLVTRKPVRSISVNALPGTISFDPTGKFIAVTNRLSHDVQILDFESAQVTTKLSGPLELTENPGLLSWSSDGELLAVSRYDGNIVVWNVPTQRITSVLQGHRANVTRCRFAHHGYLLMTFSWDNTSRLWDAGTGQCLMISQKLLGPFSQNDQRCGFIRDDEYGVCEVAHEDGIQRLHDPAIGNQTSVSPYTIGYWPAFSPNDRLLATFGPDGVLLWDLANRRKLLQLDVGNCWQVLFHPDGTELITISEAGIASWPIVETNDIRMTTWHLGPPRRIDNQTSLKSRFGCWVNGYRQIAVIDDSSRKIFVFDRTATEDMPPARILTNDIVNTTNLSANVGGNLLGIGGHFEKHIQVVNLQTEEHIRLPPIKGRGDAIFTAVFSPDQKMLVSSVAAPSAAETGYTFYDTTTWRPLRFLVSTETPCPPAFSRDGNLFAAVVAPHTVLLAQTTNGDAVARIHMSDERQNRPIGFLHGDSVLAIARQNDVVLWNLLRIGTTLREIGLPWESLQSSNPPGDSQLSVAPQSKMSVDLGRMPEYVQVVQQKHLAAEMAKSAAELQAVGKYDDAWSAFEESVKLDPENSALLNEYAWMLVTQPKLSDAHCRRAVELALKAVSLEPKNAADWNTLGVAQYRNGQYQDAIKSLETAEALMPNLWFATNGYFIAMAHAKLGDTGLAAKWLTEAMKHHDANNRGDKELDAFRREADSVINPQ